MSSNSSMNMFLNQKGDVFVESKTWGDEKNMDILESYANLDAKSLLLVGLSMHHGNSSM